MFMVHFDWRYVPYFMSHTCVLMVCDFVLRRRSLIALHYRYAKSEVLDMFIQMW